MFFRKIKTKKNGKEYIYVKLIENYRMDGKVKQRVVANFGSIDNLSSDRINYLISSLKKLKEEITTQNIETLPLQDLTNQIALLKHYLSNSELKQAINLLVDQNQPYELAEALIIKAIVAPTINIPIHEVCKQIGLINASGLQFYNLVKKMGTKEANTALIKTRLTENIDKTPSTTYIHILTSTFEGTSFDTDFLGNTFSPQAYLKQINILLACDANGSPVDYAYVEDPHELLEQVNIFVNQLVNNYKTNNIVVLDSNNILDSIKNNINYMVATPTENVSKEVQELLKQGSVIQGNYLFFKTVSFKQKNEVMIKEIKAHLAKACAGMENIKADILLDKLTKELTVRKRADSIIKANGCQDLILYSFNESSQTFDYKVNEELLKEKTRSLTNTTWVIKRSTLKNKTWQQREAVKIKTDLFDVITDQLNIPPTNMYADYHYSPEIISGHIQLEIIKYQLAMATEIPQHGGDA